MLTSLMRFSFSLCKTTLLCAAGGEAYKIKRRYKVTALSYSTMTLKVPVYAHIHREKEEERVRTQQEHKDARVFVCVGWRSSSEAIWPHSCALPPSLSPVFPPLAPSGTLAGLDRNRSSILSPIDPYGTLKKSDICLGSHVALM